MERCSLPISPRRPFVPPPLCASNKHSDQENRLSPARDTIGSGLCARTLLCAECTALARIPRVLVSRSLARSTLRREFSHRTADPANATNDRKTGRDRGPAIKSPTNDKQISHSGSPIYKCRNTLPHTRTSYAGIFLPRSYYREYADDE